LFKKQTSSKKELFYFMKKNSPHEIRFDNTSNAFSHLSDSKLKQTYAVFWMMNQNTLVKIGTFFIKVALEKGLPVKNIIKKTLFSQFCGGEDIKECQQTIENLDKFNIGTILDYSVEGEDNEDDFDKTANEILKTIEKAKENSNKIPFSVFKVSGIGSVEILEKVQNKARLSTKEIAAFDRIKDRILKISDLAATNKVRLFFDAEETWIQDIIDTLCYEMMARYNRNNETIIYNTFQLYRWQSLPNLKFISQKAYQEGFTVGAKLVRGAYMEKERERAEKMNYKSPIHEDKLSTDKDFNLAVRFVLDNLNIFAICLGTHNEESSRLCMELMEEKGIEPEDKRIYFAQLLGMSDNISFNLSKAGYRVAKYVPYGPVKAVMPYLIRRAAENSSIAGQSSREFLLIKKEVDRRKQL
jgi:proline dehydrogenase